MGVKSWWAWPVAVCGCAVALVAVAGPALAAVSPGAGGQVTGEVSVRPGPVSDPVSIDANGLRVRSVPGLRTPVEGLLYTPDRVRVVSDGPVVDGVPWELVQLSGRSAGGLPSGWVGWVATRYVAEPMCQAGYPWVPWACLADLGDLAPGSGRALSGAAGGVDDGLGG
jgi:hypothetical protein